MSKSKDLIDAEFKAKEIEAVLGIKDYHPHRYVFVRTDENFSMTVPSAFVLRHNDWYLIFAEHHDPRVFHKDDVELIYEFEITRHENKIPDAEKFKPARYSRK